MRFASPAVAGRFVRRYQRFFADVELADGARVTAHCPNTGSLIGCLEPGAPVWVRDSAKPERKLRFTWQAVCIGSTWVNVDTSLPNAVVLEGIERGLVPELAGYAEHRREVPYGRGSRIDLLLAHPERPPCFVEVKCTTYAEGSTAMFPDAPTERGKKHLAELARVARRGQRAVQFYFVSRADVELFRPADAIDPDYGRALRRAVRAGVEVLAFTARVEAQRLELLRPLPVSLSCPRSSASPRLRGSLMKPPDDCRTRRAQAAAGASSAIACPRSERR